MTLKKPLLQLLHILTRAGLNSGRLSKAEPLHIRFRPLFPPSPLEQAENELKAAETELTRALVLETYLEGNVIDRGEALALLTAAQISLTYKSSKVKSFVRTF